MNAVKLEQAVLRLPPLQRLHLVLAAWESLTEDPSITSSSHFDPEGLTLALRRDGELEQGGTQALSHEAFIRLTAGKVE